MASKWLGIIACLTLVLFVLAVSVSSSSSNSNDDGLVRYKRQSDVAVTSKTATDDGGESLETTKKPKKKGKKNKKGKKKNLTTEEVPIETEDTDSDIVATAETPGSTDDDGMLGIAAVPQAPPCKPVVDQGLGLNFTLTYDPPVLYVHEGQIINITISYSGLITPRAMVLKSTDEAMFVILSNDTFLMTPIGTDDNVTMTVTLQGVRLGVTVLQVILLNPVTFDVDDADVFTYLVKTKRIPRFIDTLFDYMLLPLVLIATCGMGCKLDLDLIKEKLRRPIPVLVGPVCQFICMPIVAVCLSKLLELDPLTAMGLLTVGSCPGGGLSNMITLLVDADLIMSVTMTFASTCLALGMLPLNLFIYGRFFIPEGSEGEAGMNLPISKIVMQIFFLTIPLLVGMLIRHKLPKVAHYVIKSLNVLSLTLVILTLGIGIYSNVYVIYSPGLVLLGGFLHPTLGFIIGFVFAKFIARFPIDSSCTVSIETGVQNNLIAISLIKLSFDQPEADIMARMPIIVAISAVSIGIGMILASIPINRRRTRNEKREKELRSVSDKYDYKPVELAEETPENGINGKVPNGVEDDVVLPHDIVVLETKPKGMDDPETVV
ncbi:ileal sodium/bile acid cotransporter-like [Asterias rubens]|uniref:ileal sodium/bile acid cotransporter-like n=1 Tax=Asterias rubens TaxID=7604 RepID=UPI001455BE2B|nr:ileal sodium/bile acid cotransporter-like [Asterias rubens]